MAEDKTNEEEDGKQEEVYEAQALRTIEEEKPFNLPWLVTFTDIMALMLTFFVLLYSMSVPTVEDWEDLTVSLNRQFKKDFSPEWYEAPQDSISIDRLDFSQAQNLNYLSSVLTDVVKSNEILKNVVLIPQKDHLVLSLPQDLLFAAGQADVSTKGKQALFTLGGLLSRIRNRIEVVGHADPRNPSRGSFSSNWELSLARATNVSLILRNVGYRRAITVRGMSSVRFDELPQELTEAERLDYARRVDILLMQDDGSKRDMVGIETTGTPP